MAKMCSFQLASTEMVCLLRFILKKKYKVRMRQMDRQKFLDLCKVALDDLEAEMIQIMKRMGLSGNFRQYYRTDSDEYRALTQSTFIELWKRGLVYLANRPNNYCPDCGTTIADAEIIHDEIPTKLVYMKFKVKETGDTIIIASTRPELLFACQAVIVNPEDDRYKSLQGKHESEEHTSELQSQSKLVCRLLPEKKNT